MSESITTYRMYQFRLYRLKEIRQRSKALSHKVEGSKRYKRARRELAKQHTHVADKRRDFQFKLAHRLCGEYDVLYFEDLNLDGMKRLWGRKVSDLGFSKFMTRLDWVALKRDKIAVKIDRKMPISQAEQSIDDLRELPLITRPSEKFLPRAFEIGLTNQLATYDSIYFALAASFNVPIITADAKQAKAAALSIDVESILDFPPFRAIASKSKDADSRALP